MTPHQPYVLHVEDDADHLELVRRCFTKMENDFELVQSQDGEQALSYLEERVEQGDPLPRLILLDLRMPRKDGLEVLREIKCDRRLKVIPVVILTTSSTPSDIQGAAEAHANGYLVKPPELASLRALLQRVDAYWLSSDKLGSCNL